MRTQIKRKSFAHPNCSTRFYGYSLHPQDHAAKEKALQTMSSMSSAQIVSASALHGKPALPASYPAVSANFLSGNAPHLKLKKKSLVLPLTFYFICVLLECNVHA